MEQRAELSAISELLVSNPTRDRGGEARDAYKNDHRQPLIDMRLPVGFVLVRDENCASQCGNQSAVNWPVHSPNWSLKKNHVPETSSTFVGSLLCS